MVAWKAVALTTVAVLALTRAASAADLLPPPPAVEPPPPPVFSADLGGWYLRGDVGVGVNNNGGFETSPGGATGIAGATETTYNPTVSESGLIDLGVGYQFNKWFRTDVTGELRGGATFQGLDVCTNCTGTGNQLSDFYRANLSSYIGMLNGYVDLGTWSGFTPYVGAGVGVAYNKLSGATDNGMNYVGGATGYPTGGYFNDAGKTDFAWAVMAGASFDVAQNLKLDFGYRYLAYGGFKSGGSNCLSGVATPTFNCQAYSLVGHRLASNDFRIGLRWLLDTGAPPPAPEAAPAQLVRKY